MDFLFLCIIKDPKRFHRVQFGIVGATEVLWEVERAWEVLKIKGFCECFENKKEIIGADPFYRTFMWMILSRYKLCMILTKQLKKYVN
ncbi:hypothetical protein Hanom_Chr14g01281081 [Helianthus anomalus]